MTETAQDPKKLNLIGALTLAQERGRGVEKDSVNPAFHYNYASSEAIITEAKHALHSTGLSLVPLKPVLSTIEREGAAREYMLHRTFSLFHVSGESLPLEISWPVIPGSGRPLDKALAGALTTSLAYLLRDLLLLPRVSEGDDMDHSSRDEGPRRSERPERNERRAPATPELSTVTNELKNALRKLPKDYAAEGWGAFKRAGRDLAKLNSLLVWARQRLAQAESAPKESASGSSPAANAEGAKASIREAVSSNKPSASTSPEPARPDWTSFTPDDVRARIGPDGPHPMRVWGDLQRPEELAESSPVAGSLLVLQHNARAVLNWWRAVGGGFSVPGNRAPTSPEEITFYKLKGLQLGQLLALAPILSTFVKPAAPAAGGAA